MLKADDYTDDETFGELKFVQRQTRYGADVALQRRIVSRIVRAGIAHVYLRVWQSLSGALKEQVKEDLQGQGQDLEGEGDLEGQGEEEDLKGRRKNLEEGQVKGELVDGRPFEVLQAALSIVWNCTDKSVELCESLARVSLLHLFLTELGAPALLHANLDADERRRYLCKAYLGILHNVARLCADSRKLLRNAGAVAVLCAYLDRAQGLVRTKVVLLLLVFCWNFFLDPFALAPCTKKVMCGLWRALCYTILILVRSRQFLINLFLEAPLAAGFAVTLDSQLSNDK